MNLTHIDPHDVIDKTVKRYAEMKKSSSSAYAPAHDLSRQVQALAEVLTDELNDALLDIENASDS